MTSREAPGTPAPADPPLAPAPESEVAGDLQGLCARLEALGFQRIGPPMTVGISPPALMVPRG